MAALDELQDDIGKGVKVGKQRIALFRHQQQVFAVEDFCPHQGALLSDGFVHGGLITCSLHAWQFRLNDGCNVDRGPGIRTFPVHVQEGRVRVQVQDQEDAGA